MLTQNGICAALLGLAETSTPEIALELRMAAKAVAELPVITNEDLAQARLLVEYNPTTQSWSVHNDRDSIINIPTRAAAARAGLRLLANLVRMYRTQYG